MFATAMRAGDFGFLDIGDVVLLGEFLVAIFAVISILRHDHSPANIIAPKGMNQRVSYAPCGGLAFRRYTAFGFGNVPRGTFVSIATDVRVVCEEYRAPQFHSRGRGDPLGLPTTEASLL